MVSSARFSIVGLAAIALAAAPAAAHTVPVVPPDAEYGRGLPTDPLPRFADVHLPGLVLPRPLPPGILFFPSALDRPLGGPRADACGRTAEKAEKKHDAPWGLGWLYGYGKDAEVETASATPFGHYLRSPLLSGLHDRRGCPPPPEPRLRDCNRKKRRLQGRGGGGEIALATRPDRHEPCPAG